MYFLSSGELEIRTVQVIQTTYTYAYSCSMFLGSEQKNRQIVATRRELPGGKASFCRSMVRITFNLTPN